MKKSYNSQVHAEDIQLTHLIANLEGGILVEDNTRHIKKVNQVFCNIFGIDVAPQALHGLDCMIALQQAKDLFKQPEAFLSATNALIHQSESITGERWHLRDGRIVSRDYAPIIIEGKCEGYLWHYHDVTEVVNAQERLERLLVLEHANREINHLFLQLDDVNAALNQTLALTGKILDVSRVYVFRFHENELILDNTHEWCAPGVKPEIDNLKGLPFDELVPSFFPLIAENDLIAPYHICELPDDLRAILEPQEIQSILWMPLYLGDRIEGFVGYDETRHARHWLPEEITMVRIIAESYARVLEREQARQMLIMARDEALRTAQLRAQFVANMSHEIRTPMTGILGMLELLLDTDLDALQQEFAQDAYSSSSRLLSIINDILDFSKLEAGQVVLEANAIDLGAIATEVKMTLAPQVKDSPITLHVDVDPQVPYRVYGDATRIRQVLMNLGGNAVKFTREGSVTIHVSVAHVHENVASLRFAVEDTGIGIAPDKIAQIFGSFVQADGSTTRKYGGSGLGLSISQQLVELMGGTITIDSTPDEGSTFAFTLRLPIAQQSSSEMDDTLDFSALQVLLVDENRTSRYVMAQRLENWQISAIQLTTLDQLATLPEPERFDLLLYRRHKKMNMPDMSVLERVQQVVCISEEPDDRYAHLENIKCLKHPIDQSSLYNVLVKVLQTKDQMETKVSPVAAEEAPPHVGRVLLAEDHYINIDIVENALEAINVHIDVVRNGREAIDQLDATDTPYDLILMDIQMPVMDGIEATRHIRQSSAPYRDIPILALTASVMQDEQAHYTEQGIDQVISKPFSVKHLRKIVLHWLQKSSGASSVADAP